MRILKVLVLGALVVIAGRAEAQKAAPVPYVPAPLTGSIEGHGDWPVAKIAGDVDSVEHLVAALYDTISGPSTKQRDWDRFRSLFLPDGRLGVIRAESEAAGDQLAHKGDVIFLTPGMYAERDDPYFKQHGFFERSLANRVEEFGNLVHVWSTYESRHEAGDAKPFSRGVNSIQMVHARGRYWLVSVVWDNERPGLTLPEKYLQ